MFCLLDGLFFELAFLLLRQRQRHSVGVETSEASKLMESRLGVQPLNNIKGINARGGIGRNA